MRYFLIFFLLLSSISYSQEASTTFLHNSCGFKTDGTGKSLGLKIKLSVPCAWKQADGERPHVVKKFSYSSGKNTAGLSFTVNKMPAVPSKAEVSEMFTPAGLKELCEGLGTFISGRKLKIDGLDCGEIAFKMTREHPIGTLYLYSLQYYFVYEDKMIVLSYSVASTIGEKAKTMFDAYKTKFRVLAGNTVFISKWE